MVVQTWLVDIPAEECEERLAASTLGRIGVVVDGRPEIFPVNHAYDASTRSVVFPTNDRTKLHGALGWPWVAFEVDGVEPDGSNGWSVMVVGRAEEITDAQEIARLAAERPARWAAGAGSRWVRIVPAKMTGRSISAVETSTVRGDHVARDDREQEHGDRGRREHVVHDRGVTR